MTMIREGRHTVQTGESVYCRAWDGRCTVNEFLSAIEHAILHGLSVPQPTRADHYLAAREVHPELIRRWPRQSLVHCGITAEARDLEDRLADDDAEPLPYRIRRRIIATLRVDPEWRDALRCLLIGEAV